MPSADASHWIGINWPQSWRRGLRDIAAEAGWQIRETDDGPQVCLEQHYRRQEVVVLRSHWQSIGSAPLSLGPLVAIASGPAPRWDSGWVQGEITRLRQSAEPGDHVAAVRYAFIFAPRPELPALVNGILGDCPELQGGAANVVSVDEGLYYRQDTLASILVREALDPGTTIRNLGEPAPRGGSGLHSLNFFGAGVYLMPVAAAMCPGWLGFVGNCDAGSVVFLYPHAWWPEQAKPHSMVDAQMPWFFTTPRSGFATPEFTLSDVKAFIEWWIGHWNHVLGELVDPSTHPDVRGLFDPYLMLGRCATLERMLTTVHCILEETGSNDFVRTALMFDALDLLDDLGAGLGRWNRLVSPAQAERDLGKVRRALQDSDAVRRIVLPRCQRAVNALLELRQGFAGGASGAGIDGRVFALLQALRNAGHGLGRNQRSREQLITLMTHDARVSSDLADLAWFHLVRLMLFGGWRRQLRTAD